MEIKKTEIADVDLLLANIRKQDLDEIEATTDDEPREAILRSMDASDVLGTIWIDGEVAVIFGASPLSLFLPHGCPWLVATNVVRPRQVIDLMNIVLGAIDTKYTFLENYVYVKNKRSINTLKRGGFQFDKPMPFGSKGKQFMRFWRVV